MKKKLLLLPFWVVVLLAACQADSDSGAETDSSYQLASSNSAKNRQEITGKYASDEGDLEITITEGMVLFKLLVVSATGRTGDMEGEITLKNNMGIYKNEFQDCYLQLEFKRNQINLTQEGSCEMGLGITATGIYKSMSEINAASVVGKIGDELGSLFYAEDNETYKAYCHHGMEEESGNIICKARLISGEDSNGITHIFSGEYSGSDGELPPLDIAKIFKIYLTR